MAKISKNLSKKNFLIKINTQIKTTRMFKLTHFKKSFLINLRVYELGKRECSGHQKKPFLMKYEAFILFL